MVSDKEVIGIMKDGGLKICEQAISKWWNATYYPGFTDDERRVFIERWKLIDKRIREIYQEMKGTL